MMMRTFGFNLALLSASLITNDVAVAQTVTCMSDNCEVNSETGAKTCIFTTKVDLYAGELGAFFIFA